MSKHDIRLPDKPTETRWLKSYYLTRAGFSIIWVACAFTIGRTLPVEAALLLIYPAWDAAANFVDGRRSGGLIRNQSQLLNFVISIVTSLSVAVALQKSMSDVIVVFGIWASLSGLLQLATGVRRWKSYGAQWPMIISGAQSALAGALFIGKAHGHASHGAATLAPYVAFGAFYFLLSGIWLLLSGVRHRQHQVAV